MGSEERNLTEILEANESMDMTKYINYVQSPECGAIATFAGTTRDSFEGKSVVQLEYEAYVPMAIRCMKSICSSARLSWNIHSIAVAHKLGIVLIGETSVFVAVSAVHRADALDACKYIIDEIKASVPIWKKEVYANGETWKENTEFLERERRSAELGKFEKVVCCSRKVKVVEEHNDGCCVGEKGKSK